MYKNRIYSIRDRNEITKKSIADMLGIDRSRYSHYENEDEIIPIKHLNKVCNYFNLSLDYVFEFTDKPNYINTKKEIDKKLAGKRLKEFRKENKISQVKFAEIFNTANTTISGYERGINIIATPFLYEICKKYNISADYLLGKIDKPKYLKRNC